MISLGASYDNVDPDPEHLGAWGYQVDAVLAGLDAEREVRRGAAHGAQVVEEHVQDVGERHGVSGTAAAGDGRVRPTAVPAERAVRPVEDEPAPVPGMQDASTGHLGQRALARGGR